MVPPEASPAWRRNWWKPRSSSPVASATSESALPALAGAKRRHPSNGSRPRPSARQRLRTAEDTLRTATGCAKPLRPQPSEAHAAQRELTIFSLRDGVGAVPLAARHLAHEGWWDLRLFLAESDEGTVRVTEEHFPEAEKLGGLLAISDLTLDSVAQSAVPEGTVLLAVDFSHRGTGALGGAPRQGLQGEKSNLLFPIAKLLRRLKAAVARTQAARVSVEHLFETNLGVCDREAHAVQAQTGSWPAVVLDTPPPYGAKRTRAFWASYQLKLREGEAWGSRSNCPELTNWAGHRLLGDAACVGVARRWLEDLPVPAAPLAYAADVAEAAEQETEPLEGPWGALQSIARSPAEEEIRTMQAYSYLEYRPAVPAQGILAGTEVPARPLQPMGEVEQGLREIRPVDPLAAIEQVWNLEEQAPRQPWPTPPQPKVPQHVDEAYAWMHNCPDFLGWLEARLRHWERRAVEAPKLRPNWRAQLPESIRAVLPTRYNAPLHAEMLRAAGAPERQVKDILRGLTVAGVLEDSLLYYALPPHLRPDSVEVAKELEAAMARAPGELRRLLRKRPAMKGMDKVLEQTRAEARAGKFSGPYEVYFDTNGTLVSTVPFEHWLPTLRFPREQLGKEASSYEYRPIDDCTASGLNLATAVHEKMRMQNLATLLSCARRVREIFADWGEEDSVPVFAKGDHEKAYRNWPVAEDEQRYLVTLVWDDSVGPNGGFQAFVHRALPFGALAAVWQYTRISQGVCQILARLFSVPKLAYVDDFLRAVPRAFAAACENAFQRVHAMLGIPLKPGKAEVSERVDALGHTLVASSKWTAMYVSDRRRSKLLARLERARRQGFTPKEPQKLGGELGFAAEACHGRCGRTFAVAVQQAKPERVKPLRDQPRALVAVNWWQALLRYPTSHIEDIHGGRRRAVLFPDGYWDSGTATGGIGALLLLEGARARAIGDFVPPHLVTQLLTAEPDAHEAKVQRNTQAELLAILCALLTWPGQLRGTDLVIYDDSKATEGNVLGGSAHSGHSNELLGAIWLLAAALGTTIWVVWLPGVANPGDCFSRPAEAAKIAEAKTILAKVNGLRDAARFPMSLSALPSHWSDTLFGLRAGTSKSEWRIQQAGRLGATDLEVCHAAAQDTLRPDGAAVLRLGHWPKYVRQQLTDVTHRHAGFVMLASKLAKSLVKGMHCTSLALRQSQAVWAAAEGLTGKWLIITFAEGVATASEHSAQGERLIFSQPLVSPRHADRHLSLVVGRAAGELSQQVRLQLRKAGFGVAPAE